MPSIFEPEFDHDTERPPFRWRGVRLGAQAGAERLGATLYELRPGGASFPLHAHHANEEMIIVLSGRPVLRTLEGERELAPGEVVACPVGRAGAHRLDNRTDEPARVLILSTKIRPDAVEYPDSGKIGVVGADPRELRLILRADAIADYYDGETEESPSA
jgi:uncharacterized cupin superfamily protein